MQDTINTEVTETTRTNTNDVLVTTGGKLTVPVGVVYTVSGALSMDAGEINIVGELVAQNGLTMSGGKLTGSGTLTGNLIQNGGSVNPG